MLGVARGKNTKQSMVSVAVVGPPMSGKTTLCCRLANCNVYPQQAFQATCSCSYLTVCVGGDEWHIWDTPGLVTPDAILQGWAGHACLNEADVVLVCHDGRHANPMELVKACGADRCVIVLTKGPGAIFDISYIGSYLTTTTRSGFPVPRANSISCIYTAIKSVLS